METVSRKSTLRKPALAVLLSAITLALVLLGGKFIVRFWRCSHAYQSVRIGMPSSDLQRVLDKYGIQCSEPSEKYSSCEISDLWHTYEVFNDPARRQVARKAFHYKRFTKTVRSFFGLS